MKQIQVDNPHGMVIEWVVSNMCNYQCSYCLPQVNGNTSGQPEYEQALKFFEYIHNNVSSGPKLLNLTGGEPTIWPRLIPFLQGLDKSYFVQLSTNGSRTTRWWKKLLDNYDNLSKVCISIHLEYANLDHIIEVSKILHERTQLTIFLPSPRSKFEIAKEWVNRIAEENLQVNIHMKPIRLESGSSEDYTQEELNYMNNFRYSKSKIKDPVGIPTHLVVDGEPKSFKYTMEMLSQNLHAFRGWKCDIGKTRLIIWHDGTVSGAQCGTAKKAPLGNMYDGKITLPTEAVTCQTDFCMCLSDIRIPKWREDV